MMEQSFAMTRRLKGTTVAAARERVEAALSEHGFGVITEIDMRATLKKKIDVDFPEYVVLGACNPGIAHRALMAEPAVGLFLPCNVVVAADGDDAVVSMMDPAALSGTMGDPAGVKEPMEEARAGLARALESI